MEKVETNLKRTKWTKSTTQQHQLCFLLFFFVLFVVVYAKYASEKEFICAAEKWEKYAQRISKISAKQQKQQQIELLLSFSCATHFRLLVPVEQIYNYNNKNAKEAAAAKAEAEAEEGNCYKTENGKHERQVRGELSLWPSTSPPSDESFSRVCHNSNGNGDDDKWYAFCFIIQMKTN